MNAKWLNVGLLGGMLLFLGGCACCSKVSTYFFGLSQGEVQLQGVATLADARVEVEGALRHAKWDVKVSSSPESDRIVLEGKTRGGNPYKVTLFRADNGKGEGLIKAKLDIAGSDMVEVRALLPVATSRPDAPPATKK